MFTREKKDERRNLTVAGDFIVKFEHVSDLFIMSVVLIFNR